MINGVIIDNQGRVVVSQNGALTASIDTTSGTLPLSSVSTNSNLAAGLIRYGKCEQASTPTPTSPVDIVCNNGVLKWDSVNQRVYADGTPEVLTLKANLWDMSQADVNCPGYKVSATVISTDGTITLTNMSGSIASRVQLTLSAAQLGLVDGRQYTVKVWVVGNNDLSTTNQSLIYVNGDYSMYKVPSPISRTWVQANGAQVQVGMLYANKYAVGDTFSVRVRLCEGSSIDKYIPYNSPQTASVADLFAVGNYKDTQDLISGLLTHKVGVKIFNGTEDWSYQQASQQTFVIARAQGQIKNIQPVCTHYEGAAIAVTGDKQIRMGENWFCLISDYRFEGDVTAFKEYLAQQYSAGTPVILLYALATPTTESLTPQTLILKSGSNTVSTVCNVSSPEAEIKYLV